MSSRAGYQLLGFAVWTGGKWYLRRRYGPWPRRVALGLLVLVGLGAAVAAVARENA